MANGKEAAIVRKWKDFVLRIVKYRFGDSINLKKVERLLDKMAEKELKNPQVYLINNTRRQVVSADALSITDMIDKEKLVVGGANTLFVPHDNMPNPMRDFIIAGQKGRKAAKKERDTYDRVGDEHNRRMWDMLNNRQNNLKIRLNSLYGVLGYAKFILHNIFHAEAVTRLGRVIISTAACGFENFLCDNCCICTASELYEYIDCIVEEYNEKWSHLDFSILGVTKRPDEVYDRIVKKCKFPMPLTVITNTKEILEHLPEPVLLMLYYKNNFMEFNRLAIIQQKLHKIFSGIPELHLPDINKIEDEDIRDEIMDLWRFYDTFVFYNHPIYDSVRKMAYESRAGVLYIDTDSNFVSLARWVNQIKHEVFNDNYPIDEREFTFVAANVITIFLTIVVDRNLKMLARDFNVAENWVEFLSMKNEFYFGRILFGDVKKRYVDLQIIQEGKLLNDGDGIIEVKGMDFIKSVTKESVREYYKDLCLEEILKPEIIDLRTILRKINWLKKELKRSMLAGESTYYRQANISAPEHYADPLRINGIRGVMLWNAIEPQYAIELPSDVDIIPIRSMSSQRGRAYLQEHWPEVYARVDKEIFSNRNPKIAAMNLTVVAKPKNTEIPMPDWLVDFMDTDRIINSTIKMINPIMESLGLKIQRPSSSKEYLTNVVDL